jgi:hypothetical protein
MRIARMAPVVVIHLDFFILRFTPQFMPVFRSNCLSKFLSFYHWYPKSSEASHPVFRVLLCTTVFTFQPDQDVFGNAYVNPAFACTAGEISSTFLFVSLVVTSSSHAMAPPASAQEQLYVSDGFPYFNVSKIP